MSDSPQPPAEIIRRVYDAMGDDKKIILKAGTLSKLWLLQQRLRVLEELLFKDENDLIQFHGLTSAPNSTFPLPGPCNVLSLQGLTTMTREGVVAMKGLVNHISAPQTLTLCIEAGGIPPSVVQAIEAWGSNITKMTIAGGTHHPKPFFGVLRSLPHLESLTIQGFEFKPTRTWWGKSNYVFPPSIKSLSVVGGASPFHFFQERVLPNGGFNNIDTLSVQTRFLFGDVGIREMLACFSRLTTIRSMKLRPIYDASCRGLCGDMRSIFSPPRPPLLQIRGLKSLEIDFSSTPAEWALDCLSICALYLPTRREGITIDIRVPRSSGLWGEQGPAVQLEQLLSQVDYDNPLARAPPQSTLIVRGFPASLPQSVAASPMVCRYPVVFVDARA